MKDRFGRKIDVLRISITDKCNFKCLYCNNQFVKLSYKEILTYEELLKLVKIFASIGIKKIKITGGEPFVRKDVFYLIKEIKKINKIEDISITTNGYYIYEYIENLKRLNIRINISIDTLNKEKFKEITSIDGLNMVINGIKILKNFLKIKINTVVMKNYNFNEIFDFVKFSYENNLFIRFIELMPVYKNFDFWKENFVPYYEVIKEIEKFIKIYFLGQFLNTKYYGSKDGKFILGFITSVSNPFCKSCNKIRINSKGDLFLCLYGDAFLNLKRALNEFREEKLKEILKKIIYLKPFSYCFPHQLNFKFPIMSLIGG